MLSKGIFTVIAPTPAGHEEGELPCMFKRKHLTTVRACYLHIVFTVVTSNPHCHSLTASCKALTALITRNNNESIREAMSSTSVWREVGGGGTTSGNKTSSNTLLR